MITEPERCLESVSCLKQVQSALHNIRVTHPLVIRYYKRDREETYLFGLETYLKMLEFFSCHLLNFFWITQEI
jgi:hypothetical protein